MRCEWRFGVDRGLEISEYKREIKVGLTDKGVGCRGEG